LSRIFRGEVVALEIHVGDERSQLRRVDGRDLFRVRRRRPTVVVPPTATPAAFSASRKRSAAAKRRVAGDVPGVVRAIDRERRERGRLVDVEGGLPARCSSARVEHRFVAVHAPHPRHASPPSSAPRASRGLPRERDGSPPPTR
jgi:hypothetical protein